MCQFFPFSLWRHFDKLSEIEETSCAVSYYIGIRYSLHLDKFLPIFFEIHTYWEELKLTLNFANFCRIFGERCQKVRKFNKTFSKKKKKKNKSRQRNNRIELIYFFEVKDLCLRSFFFKIWKYWLSLWRHKFSIGSRTASICYQIPNIKFKIFVVSILFLKLFLLKLWKYDWSPITRCDVILKSCQKRYKSTYLVLMIKRSKRMLKIHKLFLIF